MSGCSLVCRPHHMRVASIEEVLGRTAGVVVAAGTCDS